MPKSMEDIVSLCKRRGFIFQSSEIYGGINGFWDYGPLGVELKRNVREAWWRDMITLHDDLNVPAGAPAAFQMVGVETSIIMHPQVWKASGHYDLFHDMKAECKECHARFRADHLTVVVVWLVDPSSNQRRPVWSETFERVIVESGVPEDSAIPIALTHVADVGYEKTLRKRIKRHNPANADGAFEYTKTTLLDWKNHLLKHGVDLDQFAEDDVTAITPHCPKPNCDGLLTEPREFSLMFKTIIGALGTEEDAAFLRPETAQGMFVNFKNVLDSTRLKLPFGIAQIGKSFRNEITPRNFTFRSREFEQMEMEFFCHPDESRKWYEYWRDRRYAWYVRHGITSDNLILRDHTPDELSHYSVGTADVEYAFPFLEPGEYGELEGVAHRGNFDLRSHMEGKLVKDENGCLILERDANGQPKYRGSGKDLTYYDDDAFLRDKERLGLKSFKEYCEQRKSEADPGAPYRYIPHVIEPAAGADRATLAFLCEAYAVDEAPDDSGKMQSRTVLRLHPKLAPIKAAVFPLIKKDGMPETAAKIYGELKRAGIAAYYDQQAAIGRRYRRQDEIGTPYCITVDGETASDGCVTIRDRDSLEQKRVPIAEVVDHIRERL